jgi:hypothetical protein
MNAWLSLQLRMEGWRGEMRGCGRAIGGRTENVGLLLMA